MSSISYYFTTLLVAMIVSCKTLVLHTFAKSLSIFREFFTRKRKVVLLTEDEKQLASSADSNKKVVTTIMQKLVEKSKLSVSYLTTKIFSIVKAIFNSIWDLYAYILPRLVPSHIANLVSIAEAKSQGM